jgi:hypothetical protein
MTVSGKTLAGHMSSKRNDLEIRIVRPHGPGGGIPLGWSGRRVIFQRKRHEDLPSCRSSLSITGILISKNAGDGFTPT